MAACLYRSTSSRAGRQCPATTTIGGKSGEGVSSETCTARKALGSPPLPFSKRRPRTCFPRFLLRDQPSLTLLTRSHSIPGRAQRESSSSRFGASTEVRTSFGSVIGCSPCIACQARNRSPSAPRGVRAASDCPALQRGRPGQATQVRVGSSRSTAHRSSRSGQIGFRRAGRLPNLDHQQHIRHEGFAVAFDRRNLVALILSVAGEAERASRPISSTQRNRSPIGPVLLPEPSINCGPGIAPRAPIGPAAVTYTAHALLSAMDADAGDTYCEAAAAWLAMHVLTHHGGNSNNEVRSGGWISDRRMARVLEFMMTNFAKPITIEEMANEACVSKFHFSRLFRERLDQSPHRYLMELRLDAARRSLLTTALPVGYIGAACGFASAAHFSNAFARRYGVSPSRARLEHRTQRN